MDIANLIEKTRCCLFRPVESVFLQVPRALFASILAALLDCVYMVFLVEVCAWHPVWASVLSYLVGGVLQFALCSVWVFPQAPRNKASGFLAFTLLSLGGLGITWLVMAAGATFLVPYGVAKVLALGLAFVWNFVSRKFMLFGGKSSLQAEARRQAASQRPPSQEEEYADWITQMAKCARRRPRRKLGSVQP